MDRSHFQLMRIVLQGKLYYIPQNETISHYVSDYDIF